MLSASTEESTEELLAQCREQLRRVYESKEEYKALAETYYADMAACREDSQALQKQMTAMAEMMDRQRREIARLKHGKTERPPVDLTYEQMAKWVEQYYPDRLYLHPRAVRALKSAVYQNPSMVYPFCHLLIAQIDRRLFRSPIQSCDLPPLAVQHLRHGCHLFLQCLAVLLAGHHIGIVRLSQRLIFLLGLVHPA